MESNPKLFGFWDWTCPSKPQRIGFWHTNVDKNSPGEIQFELLVGGISTFHVDFTHGIIYPIHNRCIIEYFQLLHSKCRFLQRRNAIFASDIDDPANTIHWSKTKIDPCFKTKQELFCSACVGVASECLDRFYDPCHLIYERSFSVRRIRNVQNFETFKTFKLWIFRAKNINENEKYQRAMLMSVI